MPIAQITIPPQRVAEFCRRHHIRRLALFGSVLREDFRPGSDVDVLVEFEPGYTPGLDFFGMETELSEVLGRNVDLNTPAFLVNIFGIGYWPKPRLNMSRQESRLRLQHMLDHAREAVAMASGKVRSDLDNDRKLKPRRMIRGECYGN
jgi:uncharacterized protein